MEIMLRTSISVMNWSDKLNYNHNANCSNNDSTF